MSQSSDTDSLFFPGNADTPDYSIESAYMSSGKKVIAGVDEAGRGPLAGPVVAAAVVLDPNNIPDGLNDSKKLTETRREKLFNQILESSHVSWASSPSETIDLINIREASLQAMTLAAGNLELKPDQLLIDGRDVPVGLIHIGNAYVKGDSRSLSISAASIVAKVIRDRMMVNVHALFPQYGFDRHKGYGTHKHLDALNRYGPTKLHRKSFAPVRKLLED